MLLKFRLHNKPIFHIQHLSQEAHSPLWPSKSGVNFMGFAKPIVGESIFQKNVNSAFIGTKLEETLHENKIDTLIIVGISTDHCVSTSTRMAANLGFKTYVIADATIAFDRKGYDGVIYFANDIHASALASLHTEFATVMNTDDIIKTLDF